MPVSKAAKKRVTDRNGNPLPTITPPENEPTASTGGGAALHNTILVRGYKRADELELRLARVLEPILARAGNEAARRFRAMATDHLTASAPGVASTSTMIALYPRPEEARALEHAPGEEAENLHVTLAYLGDTEGPLPDLIRELQAVAANHGPLEGEVGGIGAFADGGDGHPGILLPDVPGLGELRLAVCEAVLDAGEEYARNHGFLPHLTVAYNDDLTFPSRDSYGAPLHFDHLVLVRGDVKLAEIPLVGPRPLTASAGWTPPAGDELVDVKGLVATLHTKTDPIRQALVESVMKPTLAGAGISFDVTNPLTAKVLAQSGSQIVGIAETTQLNVMRTIREGYEQGLSIPDTAKAIQAGMREAAFTRATLIARTEMVGAVNGGSLAAARIYQDATGGQALYKEWMTAPGALYPRHEDYDGLDGQTVHMDDTFEVGDDQLEYPGDPAGSPEEVCNCRCTMVYTDTPGGEEGGTTEETVSPAPYAGPFLSDGAATAALDAQQAEWGLGLSGPEKEALAYWRKEVGFKAINDYLRSGIESEGVPEAVANIDAAIAASPPLDQGVSSTVYRGVEDVRAALGDRIIAGAEVSDPGFISATTEPGVALDYTTYGPKSAIVAIDLPPGARAAWLRAAGVERSRGVYYDTMENRELVLPRGMRFEVVGVERGATLEAETGVPGETTQLSLGRTPLIRLRPILEQAEVSPVSTIEAPALNATVTSFTAEEIHGMTTGDLWRAMSRNGHAENAARADIAMDQTRLIANELWARGGATGLPLDRSGRDRGHALTERREVLPPGTLRYSDLQGEQHLHSLYSDGHNTIEEMAESARSHGLKQIVVSDHAHLLTPESLARQHAEIDALNRSYRERGIDFQIKKGIEANILPDGTMDDWLTEEMLGRFDVVNAGMHVDRALNATERYLRILDDPHVTTLAHPHTGGDVVDWDALARKAAEKGVTLEVNGRDILRLDNGPAAKKMIAAAKRAGAKLTIASDAHNDLNVVDTLYGVRFAAKEGVTLSDLAPIQVRDTISVEGEQAISAETLAKVRALEVEQGVPGPKALAVLGQARDTRELYTVEVKPLEPRAPSLAESDAITEYKGDPREGYDDERATAINGALRSGAGLTTRQATLVKNLDSAIESAAPVRDRVLYRVGRVEGDVLEDPGYLSLSRNPASGAIESGSRAIRVEVPPGTRGLDVERFIERRYGRADPEREVLFPRDTRIEIYGEQDGVLLGRLVPKPAPSGPAYTAERKAVHDEVVERLLGDHGTQKRPVALVTAGGPAAGKSVALRAHPEWIPEDSVLVNPDEIMESLPEYEAMYGDPYLAAATHEEASDIGGRLLREAIARRANLVLDGVGDGEPGKFLQKLRELKEAGYEVKVAMADAPTNTAIERSVVRATTEGSPDLGRFVPVNVVKQLYRDAVTRMEEWIDSPYVDEWNLTRTAGGWGDTAVTVVARGGGGQHEILEPDLWKEIQAKRDYVIPGENP